MGTCLFVHPAPYRLAKAPFLNVSDHPFMKSILVLSCAASWIEARGGV